MHIENEIKKIIFTNIDKKKYKVFLFWSRAKWNFDKRSDYDVGILWSKKIDFTVFLKIRSELNELPYKVDFIDFNRVDKTFKNLAIKNIKIWN
jgi:predicted nucleotidyltransferase